MIETLHGNEVIQVMIQTYEYFLLLLFSWQHIRIQGKHVSLLQRSSPRCSKYFGFVRCECNPMFTVFVSLCQEIISVNR